MRLVPFLLSAALAASAQTPGKLPWDSAPALPWKAGDCGAAEPAQGTPSTGPLLVKLTPDGALRIIDGRGMILLRTGLPGRPLRLWRDAGQVPAPGLGLTRTDLGDSILFTLGPPPGA